MAEERENLGVISARLLSSLYLGQALGVIVTVMTLILVTRLLGASNYGVYTFAFGFSALVDLVGNFGIGTYFGRNLARHLYRKDTGEIVHTLVTGYSLLIPISLFFTILGIAISPYVAGVLFRSLGISPLTLMLASSIIFFSTFESTAVQALIGLTKGKLASFVGVFTDIVQLAASVLLILSGRGVDGAIAGMLIGYAAGAVIALCLILRVISRLGPISLKLPSKSEIRHALTFVVPMSLNNVLNLSMANFAVIYLSLFVSKVTLGNYGAALKGLAFIAVFYSTASTALLPLFTTAQASHKEGKANGTYNKLILYSLMVTLPFIVYIAVMAKPGAGLLLPGSFDNTGFYFSLIALGSLIDAFQYYISNLLISNGFTTPLVKTLVVSTILQFIAVIFLVPRFGVLGAIAAIFFIGSTTESILFIRLSMRLMNFRLDYRKTLLLFASNILLTIPLALSLLLKSKILALAAGGVILLISYPALIAALGVIDGSDLRLARGISEKIPLLRLPVSLLAKYLGFLLSLRGIE